MYKTHNTNCLSIIQQSVYLYSILHYNDRCLSHLKLIYISHLFRFVISTGYYIFVNADHIVYFILHISISGTRRKSAKGCIHNLTDLRGVFEKQKSRSAMDTSNTDSFNPPTREYLVLKKFFGSLLRNISDPLLLAADLFSAELISESAKMKATEYHDRFIRNYHLLDELMIAVTLTRADSKFLKIISVLQNHPPLLSDIAEEMKREYGKNTQQHYNIIKTY